MKRFTGFIAGMGAIALAAGIAFAEDATTTPQSGASGASSSQQPATAPATDNAQPAAPATPDAAQPAPAPAAVGSTEAAPPAADALVGIREKGKQVDANADKKVAAALEAASTDVEKSVSTDGERKVADRLAADFGMTADALVSEKSELKTSWGQLMIAHSLAGNSPDGVTTRQLFDLRGEGMSWGQIANGMGLRLGEVVNAVKTEAKVAKGIAKPDGKVAVVRMAAAPKPAKMKAEAAKADAPADSKNETATPATGSAGSEGTSK